MNIYDLIEKTHEWIFYKPIEKLYWLTFNIHLKLSSESRKHHKFSEEEIYCNITYHDEYRLKYIRDLITKGENLIGIEVQDLKYLEQLEKDGKLKSWEEVEKIRLEKFHSKKKAINL